MANSKEMTRGAVFPLLFSFTMPLLLGNLLQQTYSLIDAAIVGKFLGINSLAAVGASTSVIFLILGFCNGCCAGFGIPVAQKFGARDYATMRRYVAVGLQLATVMSVVIAAISGFYCRDILRGMQTPGNIFDGAYDYLFVTFIGIPCTFFYNLLASIMRDVAEILEQMEHAEVRRLITEDKVRPDGRRVDEIRPLDAEIDFLPKVHGSGLFTRGQTQALSVLTLAPMSDTQLVDGLDPEYKKRFLHHYNFPQYSVGETGRYGAPGRREIGHGALGERALAQVLPSVEEFPYAIRLVAEVLESNGSSSQASICAGTLALMAGGVPIKAPVAGIAMGLISDGTNYTVLTDIQGLEDHFGDMDFKVAGTRQGITALQMDIKISGITPAILEEALAQAKVARFEILDVIESAIAEPRPELAPTAPKIDSIQIPVDKIKVVIGKGGETIDKIIAETGVTIDIDEEGLVQIFSSDQDAINRAKTIISDLVREAKVGEVYTVPVVRIEKFGAFVHLFNKTDALIHISELAWERTEHVEDVVKVGGTVTVKIIKIDEKGRIDASIKALLPKPEKLDDGENGGEHRHRRRSHHKPRHHNESGEAPKNPDKSETKEQTEE